MFKFENKTIDEFREEIAAKIGKRVKNAGGRFVTISDVSKLYESSELNFNGNFQFDARGEFDWEKNMSAGTKMKGFTVTCSYKYADGCTASYPCFISVPLEKALEKMFVHHIGTGPKSIVK